MTDEKPMSAEERAEMTADLCGQILLKHGTVMSPIWLVQPIADAIRAAADAAREEGWMEAWTEGRRQAFEEEAIRIAAFEEAARIVAWPSGHYQIGHSRVAYWDGEKLAAVLRALAQKPEKG